MKTIVSVCVSVEDVMMETVVEVSTECEPIEEDSFPIPPDYEPPSAKKKKGLPQTQPNAFLPSVSVLVTVCNPVLKVHFI